MVARNPDVSQLPPLTAEPETEPASAPPVDAEARILTHLLQMADGYRGSGMLCQAVEMYFELARVHAATPPGRQARERLLEMGEQYERTGQRHRARSIYEQLL